MTGVLGALLVGGRSRRYGRPKWAVEVGGVAMGRRAADALAAVAEEVVVVGDDADAADALGLEAWPDLPDGDGPLAGVGSALERASGRGRHTVVVLGTDLPLVDEAVLRRLFPDRPGEGVVPEGAGRLEPLCAAYPVTWAPAVRRALAEGVRSMHDFLGRVRFRTVPVAELERAAGRPDVLLNVNRPADRMRAEALLGPGPPVVCVVGKKNSGKTTFTVALAAELVARGRLVMTVKHGHGFDLDREGTDSWRHRREGGASRVVLAGPGDMAVLGSWGPGGEPTLREIVDRYLSDAEIVVAEGWKVGPDPKVEMYRSAAHAEPVYDPDSAQAETFLAILTDREDFRPVGTDVPILSLDDPEAARRVADLVEATLLP